MTRRKVFDANTPVPLSLEALCEHIDRMTAALSRKESGNSPTGFDGKWWVLVCGDQLDKDSFDQREEARSRVRTLLQDKGITLLEYTWIWDDTNQAQVMVGKFQRYEEAEQFGATLEKKGLRWRIIPKMAEPA
ncbi:MAG: hypothetical protein ACOC0K_01870 [bacterium]